MKSLNPFKSHTLITTFLSLLLLLTSLHTTLAHVENESNNSFGTATNISTNDNSQQQSQRIESPWIRQTNNINKTNNTNKNIDNGTYFHHKVYNESVLIVKISSPHTIYTNNFQYKIDLNVIAEHESGTADFRYGFITNDTEIINLGGLLKSEHFHTEQKDIRYLHVDINSLNYTKDNRPKSTVNGWIYSSWMNCPWNYTFPAGTWYFIFTGGMFDIDEQHLNTNISVWMNFSSQCQDLNITTYTCGKSYGIWYGEINSNLTASKRLYHETNDGFNRKGYETMLNGEITFHSNHTFLYYIPLNYYLTGFFNLEWNTPDGILQYKTSNTGIGGSIQGIDELNEPCFLHLGRPGNYTLKLNYLNLKANFLTQGKTKPPYLIVMDLELP